MENCIYIYILDQACGGQKSGNHLQKWDAAFDEISKFDNEVLKNRHKKLRPFSYKIEVLLANSGFEWNEWHNIHKFCGLSKGFRSFRFPKALYQINFFKS